ncbi:Retrovirus-related Pol polyprotein from transposon RE2 [Vitis vinifera]|uniref:Retrovirus-related Pol polyprotein from transposon RE2 n=1 Tax=Vitis vinifera TaxID=29760 RepID=A0A438CZL2_VITVI|nr:Retrovirus-related Pol polyprotein from transposon RE2 [Vitis vinifera]
MMALMKSFLVMVQARSTGAILLRGACENGVYIFPNSMVAPSTPKMVAYVHERTSIDGWHKRLGHPSIKSPFLSKTKHGPSAETHLFSSAPHLFLQQNPCPNFLSSPPSIPAPPSRPDRSSQPPPSSEPAAAIPAPPPDAGIHTTVPHASLSNSLASSLIPDSQSPHYLPLPLEPTCVTQAVSHPEWREAMSSELTALMRHGTWDLIPPPINCHPVGCKWVFRVKRKADGSVDKFKARLVAKGYNQQPGVDYNETFSPVVKPATIRTTVLSIAIMNGWPLKQMDVNNAFLHGNLTETVYMMQPPGFKDLSRPDYVSGSGKQFMVSNKPQGPGNDKKFVAHVVTKLGVFLSQHKYVRDILENTHMAGAKDVSTPLSTTQSLHLVDGTNAVNSTEYRRVIGSLQYLSLTRPDISFAVNKLSQFMHKPTVTHWTATKRLLRYLKKTIFHGLHLKSAAAPCLTTYTDADWAGNIDDRTSTSAYITFLAAIPSHGVQKNNELLLVPPQKQNIERWPMVHQKQCEVVVEDGLRSGVPLSAGKWARAVICECKEKVQDWTHEGKAIARMMGVKGMVSINPISAFKGCFFVSSARRANWFQEQERLLVKGRPILLRRWSPRENMIIPGKFRRGWLELKGLPFHLWDEDQLKFILKKWGRVTEVAREAVKLLDLTKLWVEMHPNVVLPALLEVEDGAWKYTVVVLVIRKEDEDDTVTFETTHCRYEWLKDGGCVSQTTKFAEGLRGSIRGNECYSRELLPQACYQCSSTSLAAKRENGWEGSSLGLVEENVLRPIEPVTSIKAQPVRAQRGRRSRGLHASPDAPRAHETVAASPISLQRVGSFAKATTQPCPGDERAGVEVLYGEVGRADELQAQTISNPSPPSGIEDVSYGRRTVGCKLKGPSGLGQILGGSKSSGMKGRSREEESAARKGKVPTVQMRDFTQEEKTIDSRKMWSNLFLPSVDRCHGQQNSSVPLPLRSASPFSEVRNLEVDCRTGSQKEETSTSRGEMDSQKSHLEEDKGGFTGQAGYDPRGSSVTDSPSIRRIRGGVGSLHFVGIPVHVEEENQRAFSNQLFESSTPRKSSNLMLGSPRDTAASPPGDFLIDGLSPRKMAKVREVLCSLDIKETKKEKCDRRFVGSVWTVRNKDWVVLRRVGLQGILFIWDSKKLCKEEVVLGSFSIGQVRLGGLWTSLDFCSLWSK